MSHIVLFILCCLVASSLNAVKSENPVKGPLAVAVKNSKDFDDDPISIGETDLLIENLLGLLDGLTIQIENMHVDVDLQPNINININIADPISTIFNFFGRLIGLYGGPSSAEVLARIEQGFRRIDARLAAFEAKLESLFDQLSLMIQLAMYHPIRTDIHLLLYELHETLKNPNRVQDKLTGKSNVQRFITKCSQNDPLDNLFRLYRLVDEKVTADLLPSITRAVAYNRTTFLKFGRIFASDGSLAALLTSACDAFSKTKPPRLQRAVSLINATSKSLRTHVVKTFTVDNRQFVEFARSELSALVFKHTSFSNAIIAERAHAFFVNKYPYTKRNWGVLVFNKRRLDDDRPSWLLRTGSNAEVLDDVAGRVAVLHLNGEDSRDNSWTLQVKGAVDQMKDAEEVKDSFEVADILKKNLGDLPHGFMVLVRYDLEARTDSLSDVLHHRELCCRGCWVCINCCIKWTFILGKT